MKYKIAVFLGDGVGPELVDEGIKIIEKAAELDKFEAEWIKYPHGAEHYLETKELLSDKTLKEIKNSCNAIYCGAFDNLSLINNGFNKSISSTIRNYFDQFVSIRPIKLMPNIEHPLASKTYAEINFDIIRENTEDFYIDASGRAKNGKNRHQIDIDKSLCNVKIGLNIETKGSEIAYQIGILSRKGCERIVKYAFDYARSKNRKKITFVDKANSIKYYAFWREIVDRAAKDYKDMSYDFSLVDAVVINVIRQPEKYEVIVAPNMFGDILGDLGTVLQGGLSFAAQGSINPEGISMFEPVQTIQFEAPSNFLGEISKLLSSKRGQMLEMETEGEYTSIKGKLPVAETLGLSNELRGATEGRASFSVIDQSFERLPEELQIKVIRQIRNRKGLKEEEPAPATA